LDLNEIAGAADGAARKNGKRYLMVIRSATKQDLSALLDVEKQAFEKKEGPVIADLVTQLLQDPGARPLLSLLAVDRNQAVGHILFTNTCIHGTEDPVSASILAPLAVIPHAQSKGIGGLLVDEGLKRQSESGVDLVFVLGHPEYYPRFGFNPTEPEGLIAPYPIPAEHAEAWMVQELRPGLLGHITGTVMCADALNRPEHWRE